MAKEILNLPLLCITRIIAKEATNPKPSMQIDWYCLAGHKNTRKCTFEYAGVEKKIAEKVRFCHLLSHIKLLTSIAYQLKQLLSYLARVAVLASCGSVKF